MSIFTEISFIVAIAAALGLVTRFLKQPLIIGYIIAGFVAGPLGLDIIHSEETLSLFSKLGITILLFIIGLHLNPRIIKEVGGISLVTGIGQILFTSLLGTALAMMFGFSLGAAVFIGLALTFSSTIIILKLLNDKGDLNKLYGKISVGFLLVQDIAASLILLGVAVLAQSQTTTVVDLVTILGLKIVALILGLIAISIFVLPWLIKQAAKSQETLFLFCIAWGMAVASLFLAAGLSVEIGALIAGVCLSTTAFASEISSRLRPLRDFFIVVFFILLGSEIMVQDLPALLLPALFLSLFVLIGNPLIVFYLMNGLGYHQRTSFLAGLTVAQISEFSLILITLGYDTGFVDNNVVSLVTLVGLITIALSSYLIIYASQVYNYISPVLQAISIRKRTSKSSSGSMGKTDAILFGYGRVGSDYVRTFEKLELSSLVVDFDPAVISQLEKSNINAVYGDAEDIEFMSELPLGEARLIVSTISDFEADLMLIKHVKRLNPDILIVVKSHTIPEADQLYQAGASYVIMPHFIGAHYAARMIKRHGLKSQSYKKARAEHLKFIHQRLGHSLGSV